MFLWPLPSSSRTSLSLCCLLWATEHLAARGLTVTGIDIAPDLLAVANGKLKGWKVSLLQSSFEDFRAPEASFNYIVAAQAFHWIDPAIASKKTRLLLKDNGAVILIWNIRRDADSPERAAIDALYGKYAPSLLTRPWQEPVQPPEPRKSPTTKPGPC